MPSKPSKKRRKKKKSHYKRGSHESLKCHGVAQYRSGWELAYMKYMDSSDLVSEYHYEPFVIQYLSNVRSKKVRKYYPDFLVKFADGTTKLVEIKPKKRLTNARVQKKAKAASDWCEERGYEYVILTEIELKSMGVL